MMSPIVCGSLPGNIFDVFQDVLNLVGLGHGWIHALTAVDSVLDVYSSSASRWHAAPVRVAVVQPEACEPRADRIKLVLNAD